MEENKDKIIFEKNIGNKGGVTALTIPKELRNYLNLTEGDTVRLIPEKGKHGKYIALWKKEKEEK